MSKPPQPPPRKRHLSKEDEALWDYTASSLKPLREKKGRHHPSVTDPDETPPFAPKAKSGKKHGVDAPPATAKSPAKPAAPAPARSPPAPELNAFDRKAARKLRQGQLDIEARIDLHGMRQHEAHLALRRFLLSCYSRGLRWVLVITGKGGPQRRRDDDWDDVGYGSRERGVLRKNVPMWLAEPELRAVVVSFKSASIPHGGEGALYIQLRNPDRARS
jgi:DNA-nicking Smr family endonuclease